MTSQQSDGHPDRRLLAVLVYCGLITAMTSSLGSLLVADIAHDFDLSVVSAQWVVTSSLLAGAVVTPVLGRLGDGAHARAVLVGMLVLVVLGSVLAVLARQYGVLLLGRVLQGLTFGVVPVCMTLARQHLPVGQGAGAVAALSVTTATGVGVGFPVTGLLGDLWGYRAAFAAAVVVQLPALLAVLLWVPRRPPTGWPRPLVPSVGETLLFVVGMVMLVCGISGSVPAVGWLLAPAGLLVLGAWTWTQARSSRPLLDVRLLVRPAVVVAHATAFLVGASMHIAVTAVCQVLRAPASTGYGMGLSLFVTGCFVLPLSLGSQLASRAARRGGVYRWRPVPAIAVGAVVAAVGNLVLATGGTAAWVIAVAMLLFGVGIGLCWAAAPVLITATAGVGQVGTTVAFNQILRPLGGAMGTALAGVVLAQSVQGTWPSLTGYRHVFLLDVLLCLVVLACLGLWGRSIARGATP